MPVDFQEGVVMDLVVVVVVEIETEIVDQLGLTGRFLYHCCAYLEILKM